MDEARALRSLASSIRGGATLEQALIDWPESVGDGPLRGWTKEVAARVKLGLYPADAVSGCNYSFGESLGGIFIVHAELGGDIATSLDELAQRSETLSESAAGAA